MSLKRPNILWYCTDQQRFDTIRSLGNSQIRTPNIDRLVTSGTAFRQAYAQSPICTPSRASFLTGRYPASTGVNRNGSAYFPDDEVLVTRLLAEAGYDCGLAGKLHLASASSGCEPRTEDGYRMFNWSHHPMADPESASNAYHQWLRHEKKVDPAELYRSVKGFCGPGVPAEYHQTTWCTDMAIRFIDEKRDGPWLLSLNPFDPHPPFDPPQSYLDRYDPAALDPPLFRPEDIERQKAFAEVSQQSVNASDPSGENPEHQSEADMRNAATYPPASFNGRKVKAAYYAMIELIDDQFGRLIDHLEATGQLDDTLIIFHSDHGEMLGDHGLLYKGCRFFEGLVHVPLIFAWRGRIQAGMVSDALVELVDLAPTLLEAAGLEIPTSMQGKSLLPLLTGDAEPHFHKAGVVSQFNDALGSNRTPLPTHGTMYFDGRYKSIVYHGLDLGEIYDLKEDPGEFINHWNEPASEDLKLRMLHRHLDAQMATVSPGVERVGRF